MTTSTNTHDSWLEWLSANENGIEITKKFQTQLFQTFAGTLSATECKQAFDKNKDCAFLFVKDIRENGIGIFHHMTSIGGSIGFETEETGFIHGIGKHTAFPMIPDLDTLIEKIDAAAQKVPNITDMLNLDSAEDISGLTEGSTTFKPRHFIPIPNFLVKDLDEVISKNDGNKEMMIWATVQGIKKFDETHNGDEEYTEKAKSTCKVILFWLYLTNKAGSSIKPIKTECCSSERLALHFENIKMTSLKTKNIPPTSSTSHSAALSRPLEILATTAASTHDLLEKFSSSLGNESDKSSKKFKKIPFAYQKILLMATSLGEAVPSELNPKAMEFFSQPNTLNAQVLLNSLLQAERIDCSISSAMATSLLHGSFLWVNGITPSGFASSVILSEDIIQSDTLYAGLVLDYSTKHDMSTTSLEKLTKTQVVYPTNIESMIDRIRALQVLAAFFFGNLSYTNQGLVSLVIKCSDNKRILKTKLAFDNEFIAKFLFAIDDRINKWLEQCGRVDMIVETDIELMDLGQLFRDVLLNRFNYGLPPSIRNLHTSETKPPPPKKPKTVREDSTKTTAGWINNPNIHKDWKMRKGEQWDTAFKGKSRLGPQLSLGCSPCLKYQVKGACFDDCYFKKSHCQLTSEDKTKTDTFIKSLRGE